MEGIFCELPNFSLVAGNHIYQCIIVHLNYLLDFFMSSLISLN